MKNKPSIILSLIFLGNILLFGCSQGPTKKKGASIVGQSEGAGAPGTTGNAALSSISCEGLRDNVLLSCTEISVLPGGNTAYIDELRARNCNWGTNTDGGTARLVSKCNRTNLIMSCNMPSAANSTSVVYYYEGAISRADAEIYAQNMSGSCTVSP
jgi:hypothetical protein